MEGMMNCTEACHSEFDAPAPLAGGTEEINEGPINLLIAVPNITADRETGLGDWSDTEIARAIREGIGKDDRALVMMPSHNYHVLSDDDVAALIGYLRNMGPVSNQVPEFEANIFGKVLNAIGAFGPDPVGEPITEPQTAPEPGTVEYGGYLVRLGACSDCHGSDLAGGALPFAAPEDPEAANLTPAGNLAGWTEGQFIAAVVAGLRPDGSPLADDMPRYGINEEDLRAIFAYLQTIPPVQSGQ